MLSPLITIKIFSPYSTPNNLSHRFPSPPSPPVTTKFQKSHLPSRATRIGKRANGEKLILLNILTLSQSGKWRILSAHVWNKIPVQA